MKRLIGYTAALCLLAITVGCGGVTSTGTLAYISNSTGTGFTVFTVNTDGTLTKNNISPQNTPASPKVLEFTANGKWAYFLDNAGNNIYEYTRAGNGELSTLIGTYSVTGASSLVISPNSNFVYVALPNALQGELLALSIDANTGILQAVQSPTLVSYPISQLLMAPGGSTLFGLSPTKQAIVGFSLNSSSGAVTQGNVKSVGSIPNYMILSANGSYMYVLDAAATTTISNMKPGALPGPSPNIYGFNVGSGGTLTEMAGTVFNENSDLLTGNFPSHPVAGVTSHDSRYLFVANQGTHNISIFKIATTSGEPTEVTGAVTTVNGIQVSTASPFDCGTGCTTPTFAAVSSANNALYLLDTAANKIFQYAIDQNTGRVRALSPASVTPDGPNPTWMTIR